MRIGTFNVNRFRDSNMRVRADDVIDLLRSVDLDVLVLNEVPATEEPLGRVARELGMTATFGRGNHSGNAVLARALDRQSPGGLACPEVVHLDFRPGEPRCAVIARVTLPCAISGAGASLGAGASSGAGGGALEIDVVGLHLDHTSEDARLGQLEQLFSALPRRLPCHLLAGDLNAMRLDDIAPEDLAPMRARRALEGWEPARDDVVRRLDSLGYVDAVRLSLAGSREAYAPCLSRPIAPEHAVTSRVDTRIDHVFLSPALAERARVSGARTVRTDVSDHHLVVVEIEA